MNPEPKVNTVDPSLERVYTPKERPITRAPCTSLLRELLRQSERSMAGVHPMSRQFSEAAIVAHAVSHALLELRRS